MLKIREVYFIDTVFVQALLDRNDQHHQWTLRMMPIVQSNRVIITEAVFMELTAALSGVNRAAAALFVRQCYSTPNTLVVPISHDLFFRGLSLYESRADKTWSLVDCISFVVMGENSVRLAISTDRHFEQAGFQLVS